MLGRKSTRSATTNPTKKNKFDAGKKVIAIREIPNVASVL
jgi:hypothetical protein